MIDSKAPELKPCPFCGGEAEIRQRKVHYKDWFGKDYRLMYRVRCTKCGATVGRISACLAHHDERTGEEWGAIVEWNTRAELGSGTCHITASSTDGLCSDNPRQYFELSCGHSFTLDGLGAPVACAVCGKAVEQ